MPSRPPRFAMLLVLFGSLVTSAYGADGSEGLDDSEPGSGWVGYRIVVAGTLDVTSTVVIPGEDDSEAGAMVFTEDLQFVGGSLFGDHRLYAGSTVRVSEEYDLPRLHRRVGILPVSEHDAYSARVVVENAFGTFVAFAYVAGASAWSYSIDGDVVEIVSRTAGDETVMADAASFTGSVSLDANAVAAGLSVVREGELRVSGERPLIGAFRYFPGATDEAIGSPQMSVDTPTSTQACTCGLLDLRDAAPGAWYTFRYDHAALTVAGYFGEPHLAVASVQVPP